MILWLDGHDFKYEMENVCRLFFPLETIKSVKEYEHSEKFIQTTLVSNNLQKDISVKVNFEGTCFDNSTTIMSDVKNDIEREMAYLLYSILQKLTNNSPKWGIITGVRPAKLLKAIEEETGSEENAKNYFREKFLVSDEKTNLAATVMNAQRPIYEMNKPNSFSLYISIPFCPTRCSYCSFISHSVESAKKLLPQYVEFLCKEIEEIGKIANRLNLKLETVYFGGGTPTTLSAQNILDVAKTIKENFDLSSLREYTVEAGRPDTITPQRLQALVDIGTTRISINPQTFNDSVLEVIGRRHTSKQTIDAFNLAKSYGFKNINMDLIAGLPTDTPESFSKTLDTVLNLAPESITVHTLALKRSSTLMTDNDCSIEMTEKMTGTMLEEVSKRLPQNQYSPYYMYRQSKCVGNMENVGWSLKGSECLYNVFMMDEVHSVFAAGAGAVTRLKAPHTSNIERVFNYKYPFEYVNNFDEMIRRKAKIEQFYEKYPINADC